MMEVRTASVQTSASSLRSPTVKVSHPSSVSKIESPSKSSSFPGARDRTQDRNAAFEMPRARSQSPALIRPEAPAIAGVSSALTSFGLSAGHGSGVGVVFGVLDAAGRADTTGAGGRGSSVFDRVVRRAQEQPARQTSEAVSVFRIRTMPCLRLEDSAVLAFAPSLGVGEM